MHSELKKKKLGGSDLLLENNHEDLSFALVWI